MIAEEISSYGQPPNVSVSGMTVISLIEDIIVTTIPHFKSNLAAHFHKKKKLSEDDYTQLFTKQAQILIRKKDYPFNIESQYRDIYNLSKGFSDFFFYPNELNITTASLFSVECKRLPAPDKSREKEYVIGVKNNGGIERYKTEKHGVGLKECGLIGFIEVENSDSWEVIINNWIKELAKSDHNWMEDEILYQVKADPNYYFLESIAHRKVDDINLIHLWIKLD